MRCLPWPWAGSGGASRLAANITMLSSATTHGPAVDKKGEYAAGEKPFLEVPVLSVHKVGRSSPEAARQPSYQRAARCMAGYLRPPLHLPLTYWSTQRSVTGPRSALPSQHARAGQPVLLFQRQVHPVCTTLPTSAAPHTPPARGAGAELGLPSSPPPAGQGTASRSRRRNGQLCVYPGTAVQAACLWSWPADCCACTSTSWASLTPRARPAPSPALRCRRHAGAAGGEPAGQRPGVAPRTRSAGKGRLGVGARGTPCSDV